MSTEMLSLLLNAKPAHNHESTSYQGIRQIRLTVTKCHTSNANVRYDPAPSVTVPALRSTIIAELCQRDLKTTSRGEPGIGRVAPTRHCKWRASRSTQ